jgi:hypothetical protein
MTSTADVVIEVVKVIGALVTTCVVPYVAWRMRQLEKNTNSVVTRLVAKTEILSEQIGKEKEQVRQKDREDAAATQNVESSK